MAVEFLADWASLGLDPVRDVLLGVQWILLLAYIALGSFALERAPTRAAKAGFYVLALLCAATMIAIARAHVAGVIWRLLGRWQG